LVRSGSILLLGSRLDPDWTGLPLAAGFLPFVDALVNRAARGELISLDASPGDRVALPDRVSEVVSNDRRWTVEGGAGFRPTELGSYFLLAGRDTIGSLTVNPDPRETDLTPASDGDVRGLWPGVRTADLADAGRVAFSSGARSDLRGPLLWLAAGLLLGEMGLASFRRR
jgi:hypothetical protein